MSTRQLPAVGDRFTRRDRRTYTENGARGEHAYEIVGEIVDVTADALSWRRVEVLAETGRPTTFAPFLPEKGDFAAFGWFAAIDRGDITTI